MMKDYSMHEIEWLYFDKTEHIESGARSSKDRHAWRGKKGLDRPSEKQFQI